MITLKAIKVEYNDTEFFLASIDAKDLFPHARITRAEESPEDGFQRKLGKGRAKKISEYFNSGKIIPGSLVLSSDKKYDSYDEDTMILQIPDDARLLVIDGQHRLYGAYQAEGDVFLPSCIFFDLDRPTEVQYFLDVNGYQMGVPKTLRLELEKFTAEENSDEYVLKKLFDSLDESPLSPLSGKMSRTKSVTGKLSHVAFQNALKPIINKSPMNTFDIESKTKVLVNFLLSLEEIVVDLFGDNKKVSNSAFFQGVMGAFVDICHITYNNHKNYKKSSFLDTLQPLNKIDWDIHVGTNKAAIKLLTEEIIHVISEKNRLEGDLF
ncbi:DGQHR domain-containing protein [Vibrio cholerae]|nr:DGQHR domain-containing protein [Vibrio vulnificus]